MSQYISYVTHIISKRCSFVHPMLSFCAELFTIPLSRVSIFTCLALLHSTMFASALSKSIARARPLQKSAPVVAALSRGYNTNGNYNYNQQRSAHKYVAGGVIAAAAVATTMQTETSCETGKCCKCKDKYAHTAYFPPIQPYEKGMLKVSDIHTIAYSVYGNPNGKPVLVVHGGPGGGTTPGEILPITNCKLSSKALLNLTLRLVSCIEMARYFDPKVYRVVLVDQRGCGDSTPFANLVDNTTYDSVRDFEKVRVKLGIEKWQVFGGSWGSTLSLVYAVGLFCNCHFHASWMLVFID